jgi:hypothetical protein
LRYFGYKRGKQASYQIARVLKRDGLALIGEVLQRNTWPYLTLDFQKNLKKYLLTDLTHTRGNVFRNTTFYTLRHQYKYHQERDYNQIFKLTVDEVKGKKNYLEFLSNLAGFKTGEISLISASKNKSIITKGVKDAEINEANSPISPRVVTSKGRLKNVDRYMLSKLDEDSRVIVDIGTGYPPVTVMELAGKLMKQYPRVKLIAPEIYIPAYVVEVSAADKGLARVLFNEKGEIINIDYTALEIVPKLSRIAKEEIQLYLYLRDKLIQKGRGRDFVDEESNRIIFNPMIKYAKEYNNLSIILEDFRNLKL